MTLTEAEEIATKRHGFTDLEARAYALGFLDGREGFELSPMIFTDSLVRDTFVMGYNDGVRDRPEFFLTD